MANKHFHVPMKGKLDPLVSLEEALALLKTGGFVWLNFIPPSKEELSMLIEPLGLHPLAIEDCLNDDQVPKIEDYPNNTFLILNTFFNQGTKVVIGEVNIFIGKNYIILVCRDEREKSLNLAKITEIINSNLPQTTLGPDYFLHVIMDYIIDNKFHAIDALEDELNQQEDKILKDLAAFKPERLIKLKRTLLGIRKSLIHEREILIKICRKDSPFIGEKCIYNFRDIYDHITKFYESSEILREMISNHMEIYLSMMNNKLSMYANKTNQVVRRLTLITTVFMPLTLIAGIGGMSEWSMMTGSENWRYSYPLFILFMIAVGGINYLWLKKLEAQDKEDAGGYDKKI